MIIGISGKIGSGKSHVAKFLKKKLKFAIISEDKIITQLFDNEKIKAELVKSFGRRILHPNLKINREHLQKKYSRDENTVKTFYSIIIPAVSKEIRKIFRENEDNYILDVSSPERYKITSYFDVSVVVSAPKALSFKRSRLSIPYKNFSNIWIWQKDTKKYDFIIENKTSINDLKTDIEDLIIEMFKNQPKVENEV
ncbi:dephospho-CoA kinase [Candidatus Dojkabacteria bacterium]|nr:dephospho-CoA kinase [Candidatus Dojkabacteria bacterium]